MNPTPAPTRAVIDDELRARMVLRIMTRDRISAEAARQVLNAMSVPDLTRLELEVRDSAASAFTADYDPYAR